jgi:tetratricopeptide (TPR) repeat protein
MKTFTFYSYKGGVGRTLALANTAKRLSEFRKKVCLLDFDLEAPGLHLKFQSYLDSATDFKGVVDYMHEFATTNKIASSIIPYKRTIKFNNHFQQDIDLISAGNIEGADYWKKLSAIHWNEFFYNKDSLGVPFFLDLKEKIRTELNPDYLLVDSRTGISEVSGITLSLLADEVVIVAANNKENLSGVRLVLKSISNVENALLGKVPKIHFALSRIPYPTNEFERFRENNIKSFVLKSLELSDRSILSQDIIIIHSDRNLELQESLKISDDSNKRSDSVAIDYIELFEQLVLKDLSAAEIEEFNAIQTAEGLYKEAKKLTEDTAKSIQLLTQAIQLAPNVAKFYYERGLCYNELKNWDCAITDFQMSLDLDDKEVDYYLCLGDSYRRVKLYNEALQILSLAAKLNPNESEVFGEIAKVYQAQNNYKTALEFYEKAYALSPLSSDAVNGIANLYRLLGSFNQALDYVRKALEIDPENCYAYGTYAEIKAALNEHEDFYLFLTIALNLDSSIAKDFIKDPIYTRYLKEKRFVELLKRYEINI